MKNNLLKICIVTIIIFIIFLISSPILLYMRYNVDHECTENIEEFLVDMRQNDKLMINDYLDFEYDGFYIIGPYTNSDMKKNIIGKPAFHYNSFFEYAFDNLLFDGTTLTDEIQEIYFVKDYVVVAVAVLDRKNGDFLNYAEMYIDNNSNLQMNEENIIFVD